MKRCQWAGEDPLMQQYHDREWCVPSRDDRYIFEMLSLEGAQAGLSWKQVLHKRTAYRTAFHDFDIVRCANLTDEELSGIKMNHGVIRHMGKLESVRTNAGAVLEIRKEFGTFAGYLWGYVDHAPIVNRHKTDDDIPASTELSERLSKDLKKRGFKFTGPVIIYSFMQAIGMVNDHVEACGCHPGI
ncbi:DNA-3-methyladenine glycosylase I [Salinicoccus carnicancri]|uniref:DNA-3-methyladenine glycosylase I n=1 Tax=Salinicoccus carnicancri TaxID=558170 RepID=UPI0002D9DDF8|nr:DNA-3-methyladenine glycosylase I [Salinicoccus carnicancri]